MLAPLIAMVGVVGARAAPLIGVFAMRMQMLKIVKKRALINMYMALMARVHS